MRRNFPVRKRATKQNTHLGVGDLARVPLLHTVAVCAMKKCRREFYLGGDPACSCRYADKYHAVRCYVAGFYFPSLKEARRFSKLAFLEKRLVIRNLERQPSYPIFINGVKACDVRLDFRYECDGITVVEDTKGAMTSKGKLKQKMLEAYYPDLQLVIL